MLYQTPEELTQAVRAAYATGPDPLFNARMNRVITAIHSLLHELRLTEAEFQAFLDFLVRVGQACNETHNEAVLLADLLGASTLVMLLNGQDKACAEDGALLGPFYREGAPLLPSGASLLMSDTPGEPMRFDGRVVDVDGQPLSNVEVAVWQSSPQGLYENQDESQADMNLRGRFITDADGAFHFMTVKPAGYPVPTHGPSGEILRAARRSEFRPAHIHFVLLRDGFETLVTQRFYDTREALESDVVFGARHSLVGSLELLKDERGEPVWHAASRFTMRPGVPHRPTPPIA